MAGQERKVTELPIANTITSNDVIIVVTDVETNPKTQVVSPETLFNSNLSFNINELILNDKTSPANNSTISANNIGDTGRIFFDDNFLYIKTSNNIIKRIALSSF